MLCKNKVGLQNGSNKSYIPHYMIGYILTLSKLPLFQDANSNKLRNKAIIKAIANGIIC